MLHLLNIDLRSISTHVCDVVSVPRRVSLMEDNSSHRPEKSYLSSLVSPKLLKVETHKVEIWRGTVSLNFEILEINSVSLIFRRSIEDLVALKCFFAQKKISKAF